MSGECVVVAKMVARDVSNVDFANVVSGGRVLVEVTMVVFSASLVDDCLSTVDDGPSVVVFGDVVVLVVVVVVVVVVVSSPKQTVSTKKA